ncbi:acyltransferase ChoActase/COT/CPT [Flagelloscypha sp. PMI_526]|nr:acyltransferase ChoActase/COT/CPT [Flagelloscypha sp. PMI_526]
MLRLASVRSGSRNLRQLTVPMSHKLSTDTPMLRFQNAIPKLPVPTLAATGAKYLESVQPILSPEAYKKTEHVVNEFITSPQGTELQKRLEARAGDPNVTSWLADWWNDVAYMGYRDPVVVFVSYFFVHVNDPQRTTAPTRAAALIKSMLTFRQLTESGELEPEKIRGQALCMASYKWLFHSSRYPVKPSDTAHKFDPKTHNHVVFIRKNRFYAVPLTNSTGQELSAAELEVQIERIIKSAGDINTTPPIGVLSSDNRDEWTDARASLIAASPSGLNQKSLEVIESAMIVVPLDDTKPETREQISWACWTGDGRNRFYDKHQLIVFENGRSGFLGEHSCMDGTPTLRMNEFMLATLAGNKVDLGAPRTADTGKDLPEPAELKFEVTDTVQTLVTGAEKRFDELIGKHDLHVLQYTGYGKNLMKKMKTSPDAWVQMVKQLAFHKMFGRPGRTYESAQTRKFQLGRTEVIRSASNESKAWAEAMLNPNESDSRRAALFRAAVARHLQYSGWAADGQGVDRHLFGLKKLLKEGEPLPEIYKDEAFSTTNHWELSTSQLSSPFFDGWGYGEVVPDGYGLAYAIGDDYIRWTITSLKLRTAELKGHLEEAANETRAMLERAAAAAPKL